MHDACTATLCTDKSPQRPYKLHFQKVLQLFLSNYQQMKKEKKNNRIEKQTVKTEKEYISACNYAYCVRMKKTREKMCANEERKINK